MKPAQELRIYLEHLAEHFANPFGVIDRSVGERVRAVELRLHVGVFGIFGIEQAERLDGLFPLTGSGPCFTDDGHQGRSRFSLLMAREVDAVGELARPICLAQDQVNHRALGPGFVGDRRHDLVEIDLLERLQREARIFVQEELRLGKEWQPCPPS